MGNERFLKDEKSRTHIYNNEKKANFEEVFVDKIFSWGALM